MKHIRFALGLAFLAFGAIAQADTILFTISGGPICPLQGPCVAPSDAFYDVATTTFTGDVQNDGSIVVTDSIQLDYNGGSESITLSVVNQVLTADVFNPPVVAGVLPIGNWTGLFAWVASDGGQGTIDLAPNSGQTFFIDNEEAAFNFALSGGDGATTINFFVTGNAELLPTPVPLPAGAWLLVSALGVLAGTRKA